MADLDQSGRVSQRVKVWRGPSLGWSEIEVQPTVTLSQAGIFAVPLGTHTILCAVTGIVIDLPDINVWCNSPQFYPGANYENSIWIKDISGLVSLASPLIITPFGTQAIDGLAQNWQIIQARGEIRLYPRSPLSLGWISG